MTQDIRLYQGASIWDRPMQQGQKNLLAAMLDCWPSSARTALDVGCGDGKLSGVLAQAKGVAMQGLDSSAEALSRLPYPGVLGDATVLPFEDRSIDLVLSSDALEHMPDAVEERAWSELFRVARDWVMVAVPFRECLLDATACCRDCGLPYHVNWHQRAYDAADLHRRAPEGWSIAATVVCGESWSPMLPLETFYRQAFLGQYCGWDQALCAHCGAAGEAVPAPPLLDAEPAATLGKSIYEDLLNGRYWRSHSEVLVVFSRSAALPMEVACATARTASAAQLDTVQPFARMLEPFPQVAQWVVAQDGQWRIQLPLYGDPRHLRVIRTPGSTTDILMTVEDGAGLLFSGVALLAKQSQVDLPFERNVVAGYYGVLISVEPGTALQSVSLGEGQPILRLAPPADLPVAYHRAECAGAMVLIQVTNPLWWDPATCQQWRQPPFPEGN
jgi:SAM-dependent methyltransferase